MSSGRLSSSSSPPGKEQETKCNQLFYVICELQEYLEALADGVDPGNPPVDPQARKQFAIEPCPEDMTYRESWFVSTQEKAFNMMVTEIEELDTAAKKLTTVWLKHAMTAAVQQFKVFQKEVEEYIRPPEK
jgi:hypothetical protein